MPLFSVDVARDARISSVWLLTGAPGLHRVEAVGHTGDGWIVCLGLDEAAEKAQYDWISDEDVFDVEILIP